MTEDTHNVVSSVGSITTFKEIPTYTHEQMHVVKVEKIREDMIKTKVSCCLYVEYLLTDRMRRG